MSEWIPEEAWATVVENVPVVSVDLVVECPEGIVFGKRVNEPAKGEWFVPGGRVRKGERLEEAVHRVADEELEIEVEVLETLGAFEHFYETSEVGCAKHYIAHGYHVRTEATTFSPDGQHGEIAVFEEPPAELHEYVAAYLAEAGVSESAAHSR